MIPRLPDYGHGSLADLLPSIGAQFGVPNAADVIGLPQAEQYVVVLIDGLGAQLLDDHADHAPYLASLRGRRLTSGVPSTTATSITSLGTGLTPGRHAVPPAGARRAPVLTHETTRLTPVPTRPDTTRRSSGSERIAP